MLKNFYYDNTMMIKKNVPVSVVIPCYCCADTISRAVGSIIKQTVSPVEIFLVEDGSPDNGETLKQLYLLEKEYSRFIHIEIIALDLNMGPSAARNKGWCRATQKYIAFLDADDSWDCEKVNIQYEYMSQNPSIVLSGHLCRAPGDLTHQSLDSLYSNPSVTFLNKKSVLLRNPFSTPSVMLKKDVSFRFAEDKKRAEDFLLWQEIICSGGEAVRLDCCLASIHKARYGESGLSSQLWAMEKAELDNYERLKKSGKISVGVSVMLKFYSFMKYLKRCVKVWLTSGE